MIIEVLPKDDCSNCVFCEEMIYCSLLNGKHIEFVNEAWGKAKETFCPLINKGKNITDEIRVIER